MPKTKTVSASCRTQNFLCFVGGMAVVLLVEFAAASIAHNVPAIISQFTAQAPDQQFCMDSDGGLPAEGPGGQLYIAGRATGTKVLRWDPVLLRSVPGMVEDTCDNNVLSEARCISNCGDDEDACVFYNTFTCPNGCRDGACLPEQLPAFFYKSARWTCQDGLSSSGMGECVESPVWVRKAEEFCAGHCGSTGKCGTSNFAVGESCIPGEQPPHLPPPPPPSPSPCTDSDGGIDIYTPGIARQGQKESKDVCHTSTWLVEGDCGRENGVQGSNHPGLGGTGYDCPHGCKDGACVRDDEPGCGRYKIGESWSNACNKCSCTDRGAICTLQACPPEPVAPAVPSMDFEDEVRVIERSTAPVSVFIDLNPATNVGMAADFLFRNGIIGGFPDHTFRANQSVNRAEAAKFLMLARYKNVQEQRNSGRFWDIPDGEWYVRFVMKAAELGIISGYPDGAFRPQNPVKTAEFLKMLTLTFDAPRDMAFVYTDVPSDSWFTSFAGIAQHYQLFPDRPQGWLLPEKELTRGEVAIAIYTLLNRSN